MKLLTMKEKYLTVYPWFEPYHFIFFTTFSLALTFSKKKFNLNFHRNDNSLCKYILEIESNLRNTNNSNLRQYISKHCVIR